MLYKCVYISINETHIYIYIQHRYIGICVVYHIHIRGVNPGMVDSRWTPSAMTGTSFMGAAPRSSCQELRAGAGLLDKRDSGVDSLSSLSNHRAFQKPGVSPGIVMVS